MNAVSKKVFQKETIQMPGGLLELNIKKWAKNLKLYKVCCNYELHNRPQWKSQTFSRFRRKFTEQGLWSSPWRETGRQMQKWRPEISLAKEGGHWIIRSAALHSEGLHLLLSRCLDFQQAVVRPLPFIQLHYSLHLLYTLVFSLQCLRDGKNRFRQNLGWPGTRETRPDLKVTPYPL